MNREAIKRNANATIEQQDKLAKSGKDFSVHSIMGAERMLEVADIHLTRADRELLKVLAMKPNPEWREAKEIKERYGISWNELKALAFTCTESEVKQIREMSGLSRNAFAEKYHIPIRTLEKWEREETIPADYLIEWLDRLVRIDNGKGE